MKRLLTVAQREFLATVLNKGYLIGILLPIVLMTLVILLLPKLMNEKAPRVEGEIAVLDPTGEVTELFRQHISPEAMAERRIEEVKKPLAEAPEEVQALAAGAMNNPVAKAAMETALGQVPQLTVKALPADAKLVEEKKPLLVGKIEAGGQRLAVAVIKPDAVMKQEGKDEFGTWDLYVRPKLDDRLADELRYGLREAVVAARVSKAGLDRKTIDSLMEPTRPPRSITVTAEGEQKTNEVITVLLPIGFAGLLMMSVLIGGSGLLMSTIEEKSSRVVEVLLSAVSPMELMAGKVLGQMGAALLILVLYSSLGTAALVVFALAGVLEWTMLLYLLAFFFVTYLFFASMLGAIGAAVNDVREAQTLQTPVILTLVVPYMFWFPISRNPNSWFSTIISFVPPCNSFAMLLRMTSTSPPPAWQPILSLLIGAAASAVALWAAAKVFRIGLLQFGKAPDYKTMWRWIRMA